MSLGIVWRRTRDNAYVVSYFEGGGQGPGGRHGPQAGQIEPWTRASGSSAAAYRPPGSVRVVEVWEDQAQEAHGAAAHAAFREKLKPARPYDDFRIVLSVGSAPAAGAKGAIYVVTHVDVFEGQG
jgi:hypothetical protein